MLKEAMQFLAETAVKAESVEVINPTNDPRSRLLVKPDGSYERLAVAPSLHAEKLASVKEFGAFVAKEKMEDAIVYVTLGRLLAAYDKNDRRDVATCELAPNEQWLAIKGVAGREFDQRAFWKLLRVQFDGCLPDSRLLDLVKSIKWMSNDQGSSTVGNANHAMGRQLIQDVQGTDAIPETVTLSVPVWADLNLPFRVPIRCALDANPDTRTFSLTPLPNQITVGELAALEFLKGQVVGLVSDGVSDGVPVYLGQM